MRALYALFLVSLGGCSSTHAQGDAFDATVDAVYVPESCATAQTCESCAAMENCGFCGQTGECMQGGADGPDGGMCGAAWIWTGDLCPGGTDAGMKQQAQCALIDNCGECADQAACGWCRSSGQCAIGTTAGPAAGGCAASDWVTDFNACP